MEPTSPSGRQVNQKPEPRTYARFPLREYKSSATEEAAPRSSATREDSASVDDFKEWADLVETLRTNRRRLLRLPGVTAVDVGYKIKESENNLFLNELAVRVHVERKLPKERFQDRPHELIDPANYRHPTGKIVTMDVVEADYKPSQFPPFRPGREAPTETADPRRRVEPLVGGISIGSPQVPVGTLGALVWDRLDGSVCILSNWHVLAGGLQAEVGTPCFQPGRFDQGRSSDVVARLKRWSFDSHTDAALSELTGSRSYCAGEILSLFQPIAKVTEPYLGMRVLKSGRSTGFSQGFIDGLFFSGKIEYSNGITQVFEDQIHIAPRPDEYDRISEPGDSGAVWVTKAAEEGYLAVGLHFAGDLPNAAFGEYALANPMVCVAERLGFSFRPLFREIQEGEVSSVVAQSATGQQPGLGARPQRFTEGAGGPGSQPVDDEKGGGG